LIQRGNSAVEAGKRSWGYPKLMGLFNPQWSPAVEAGKSVPLYKSISASAIPAMEPGR